MTDKSMGLVEDLNNIVLPILLIKKCINLIYNNPKLNWNCELFYKILNELIEMNRIMIFWTIIISLVSRSTHRE